MKTILYVGGFDLPDRNAAAQRVINNAKLLRDIGYQVSLVGLGTHVEVFRFEGFLCRNLKYPDSIGGWVRYITSIRQLVPLIKECAPTIIIAYNYPAIALEKLRRKCIHNNIKLIADCTEWYTPEGSLLFRLVKGIDISRRMKRIHPRMDGIISISRYLHDYYCNLGVKSLLLPPLVDIKEPKWKPHVSLSDDKLRLVYAGSPGHKDRLDLLVDAVMRSVKDRSVFFTIIGLDEPQFRRLYNYTNVIPDFILFKGRLSHNEVINELITADFQIFVREDNITTRAGFPTKFVESITAGLPVITNLSSNLGDYLSDGKNGYVLDLSTEESLRDSLSSVLLKSEEEINTVKSSINRLTFDYRQYIGQMEFFLESI